MNWHEPTPEEIDGNGDWSFIVDILPGEIPHQAGVDGDALIRICRPGWIWSIKPFEFDKKGKRHLRAAPWEMGESETRPAAIADAQAALARLRVAP